MGNVQYKLTEWSQWTTLSTLADQQDPWSAFEFLDCVEICDNPSVNMINYNHWAIYLGEGNIAHVTTQSIGQLSSGVAMASSPVASAVVTPSVGRSATNTATVAEFLAAVPSPSGSVAQVSYGITAIAARSAEYLVKHGLHLSGKSPPEDRENYYVQINQLCDVVGTQGFRVNNQVDAKYPEYKKRTEDDFFKLLKEYQSIKKPFPYSIYFANCETWVNGMRLTKPPDDTGA